MKRPNLFILGGQKCGTTALAHFLGQHPEIFIAEGKEAHIFDHPEIEPSDHQQLDSAYCHFFREGQSQNYYCDATPIYSYWTDLLPFIADYSPDAKIIFMVRDPVERAVSQYMMESNRGYERLPMLQAFLKEPERLLQAQQNRKEWMSPSRWASYLDRGYFQQQLDVIRSVFSEDRLLILHNDDLRHCHDDTLSRVYQFLHVEYLKTEPKTVFSGNYRKKTMLDYLARRYARWKLKDEIQFVRQFRQSND
ncbi:sulfotransferase family protein [Vibrio quintilis]|uniref:Sulfotransferase domain protein n=1 Tax=Vibrio quintilis TaxID=1117707 RepID=A0A1M7YYA8_9VIBR|nr:sulfotransferase [Vibrio quintilis]SHO57574.1 Sulfotransferase domain protein [Vibrio quintilis]